MSETSSSHTTLISYASLGQKLSLADTDSSDEVFKNASNEQRMQNTRNSSPKNRQSLREYFKRKLKGKVDSPAVMSHLAFNSESSTRCGTGSSRSKCDTSSIYSIPDVKRHKFRFWLEEENLSVNLPSTDSNLQFLENTQCGDNIVQYQSRLTANESLISKSESDHLLDYSTASRFPLSGADSNLKFSSQPICQKKPAEEIIIYRRMRKHRIRLWLNKYLPEDNYKGSITEVRISEITARILETRDRAIQAASEAAEQAKIRQRRRKLKYACAVAASCFARVKAAEKMPGASHGSLATEFMNASEELAKAAVVSRFYNKDYQNMRAKFNAHFKFKGSDDYHRPIVPVRVSDMDKNSGAYQMYVRMKRIPQPPSLLGDISEFHRNRLVKREREFEVRYEKFIQESGIKRIKIHT